MSTYSLFNWIIVCSVIAFLLVLPFWRILPRAGVPSWVAVFSLFPGIAVVLLWVLAFKTWPGDEKAA